MSTDTHKMGLDTSSSGFDFSLSRAIGGGLRLGAGVDGPLARGQLGAVTLQYAPDEQTNASVALRRWYGQTTLLEARCWRQVGRRWQFGGLASSQATLSLFLKHRM